MNSVQNDEDLEIFGRISFLVQSIAERISISHSILTIVQMIL